MKRWISTGVVVLVASAGLAAVLAGPAEGLVVDGFFSDDNGHLFESDIDAIAQAGVTKGCNPPANDRYCPDETVDRGAMAAFLRRALNLPATATDHFVDDNTSIFEADINAVAEAGITRGCNPPANDRYCPNGTVTRGQMAAFLSRALPLPGTTADHFVDDNTSIFEADINVIAEAGITRGCNPPANDRYCPNGTVTRGQMAAFLRRAFGYSAVSLNLPLIDHGDLRCDKDGLRCSFTAYVSSGRAYQIREGVFQVVPATADEEDAFGAAGTNFALTVNGNPATLTFLSNTTEDGIAFRRWAIDVSFEPGSHTLVGRWRWDGDLIQTVTVTVRAQG